MTRYLITGAAGFLGGYVVRALAAKEGQIRAFDLAPSNLRDVSDRQDNALDDRETFLDRSEGNVEWVIGDVRNAAAVREACEGVGVIIHLASLIPQRKADAETMQAVNVGGTQHVLDAALALGVRRVVYMSSAEIYGVPTTTPCPETSSPAPLAVYGRNKVAAEGRCRGAAARGLEVAILRPCTIVGPGLVESFILDMMAAVRAGKPVLLLGRGTNRFQFVHAQDVAAACVVAASHPTAVGEAFNLGCADVPPLRELVERVIRGVGSSSSLRSLPLPLVRLIMAVLRPIGKAPLAPEHLAIVTQDYLFDTSKARTRLGWHPRWGAIESLIDTYHGQSTA